MISGQLDNKESIVCYDVMSGENLVSAYWGEVHFIFQCVQYVQCDIVFQLNKDLT